MMIPLQWDCFWGLQSVGPVLVGTVVVLMCKCFQETWPQLSEGVKAGIIGMQLSMTF